MVTVDMPPFSSFSTMWLPWMAAVRVPPLIQNAVNSGDHTTLVAAVKAAGLVDTLQGPGPFTVFAPTNEAFAKLPAGTVDTLLKPENKDMLAKILTYHVVASRISASDLKKKIKAGNGEACTYDVSN